MTLILPSLHDRVCELEDHVFRIYDWTHEADERAEQHRNRLDYLVQGIRDVRADLNHLTTAVARLDAMLEELIRLARPA
jgi:chromosome segregation ATPase